MQKQFPKKEGLAFTKAVDITLGRAAVVNKVRQLQAAEHPTRVPESRCGLPGA